MINSINSIEAFVLHKQWSGETSASVSFFTRELGLIQCLCKGGRTQKKQAHLQVFTPLWLSVNERYNRHYVQSVESLNPTLGLVGDSLFSGFYLNELLFYTLSPLEPEPELFNAYLHTLNALAAVVIRQEMEPLLRRFEWALLKALGYSFSMTQEAGSSTLIGAEKTYRFIPSEGFIPHTQGIPGSHIQALATDNLSETKYRQSAKWIMRQAIDHLLGGREIKARALYQT
jgi:DNA repair protein RecO (recombination protein O)